MILRRSVLAAGAVSPITFRAMAQSGAAGKTLTYGQSTAILTLDPSHGAFSGYPAGYEAGLCLYDRMLDFDAHMNIVPGIVESWSIADDLKSATLRVRSGVKFHDGTDCDAEAVRFNLARCMDRQRTTTNRPLWDPLASVEAVDARTVVIKLKGPFSQLANSLAHGSAAVVSPAAVAKYRENNIAQNPVGAGPFRLASFTAGQELVLEAFPSYWGGKPRTDRIVFRFIPEAATRVSALRTGSVDVIDSVSVPLAGPLKSDPNLAIMSVPSLRPVGCVINMSRDAMKNKVVRQALNLAVPVETIAEKVFQGFARVPDSPLAFNTQGYHSVGKLTYDPEQAKALMAEAGYGPAGKLKLVFNVPVGVFPNDVAVAEVVTNSLQQIGIEVQINKVQGGAYWETLRQERDGLKWDIAMFGFNPTNASGLYQLMSLFKSSVNDADRPEVWNVGRYRNPEVDDLLAKANETTDRSRQDELLAKAQEIIWKDAPYIWLQINDNISAVRKTVKDVEVWPIGFSNLRRATG